MVFRTSDMTTPTDSLSVTQCDFPLLWFSGPVVCLNWLFYDNVSTTPRLCCVEWGKVTVVWLWLVSLHRRNRRLTRKLFEETHINQQKSQSRKPEPNKSLTSCSRVLCDTCHFRIPFLEHSSWACLSPWVHYRYHWYMQTLTDRFRWNFVSTQGLSIMFP